MGNILCGGRVRWFLNELSQGRSQKFFLEWIQNFFYGKKVFKGVKCLFPLNNAGKIKKFFLGAWV